MHSALRWLFCWCCLPCVASDECMACVCCKFKFMRAEETPCLVTWHFSRTWKCLGPEYY